MSLRIGFISAYWLPRFGGAEQYEYRLARALTREGFDVGVFTSTAAKSGFDNGAIEAERFTRFGDMPFGAWGLFNLANQEMASEYLIHLEFIEAAAQWAKSTDRQIVLISNPFNLFRNPHARELYAALRGAGIRAGMLFHDLPHGLTQVLRHEYTSGGRNWRDVSQFVEDILRRNVEGVGEKARAFHNRSPLILSPDFVVSCSHWNLRFIDPKDDVPKFALRPILDTEFLSERLPDGDKFKMVDILMVNPQGRKGPAIMRDLIANADPNWTFRILKGGWGNSFETFIPTLKGLPAFEDNRIDFVEYVEDIRKAYQATRLIFFPSLDEGYGMTAVEPMFSGASVVSSNFPPILEGVGDAAITLCPFFDGAEKWKSAVKDALDRHDYWSAKSRKRK